MRDWPGGKEVGGGEVGVAGGGGGGTSEQVAVNWLSMSIEIPLMVAEWA